MDIKNAKPGPQPQKNSKVGILLAGISTIIGIVAVISAMFGSKLNHLIVGNRVSGPPLPSFTTFDLDLSDAIRNHMVTVVCIGLAFLFAGLAKIYAPGFLFRQQDGKK